MYSTMQNGHAKPEEEKYRSIDVRSDTVTKPTPEMMAAIMEVLDLVISGPIKVIHVTRSFSLPGWCR